MEEATAQGYYLAGFISYEAGYAFEKKLLREGAFGFPLLCFGVFNKPVELPLGGGRPDKIKDRIFNSCLNMSAGDYFSKIERIREYIAAGETYQITFCLKEKFNYAGNPYELYEHLLGYQPVPYPAFISCGDYSILSLSPEMFIKKDGGTIRVKPMKGTLVRSSGVINNLFGAAYLRNDPKNRAENVMIADLLRNDLGRVCDYKSVVTTRLFEVAKYRTVYQMTSSIRGDLRAGIPYYELFRALFPSGSVTGAPKIRAMQIIRELENEERRIYTGAIGFITPQRDLFFNVPIRTILLRKGEGEMGVGGGITYYSTPRGEFEECLIKSRFIKSAL